MYYKNPLTYILPLLFIFILAINMGIASEQQFVLLAKSFKDGSLAFTNIGIDISDAAFFEGKYYWPLGPFPALLILPFLYISPHFYQGFLSFPVTVLNFILLYSLAKKLGLEKKRSMLLTIFFVFGSIYTPLAALPGSWYFAQVLACTFLILALYEFIYKKGYFLTGIFLSLAIGTRFTLLFSSVFFIYLILKENNFSLKLLKFSLPIIVTLTLIATYNNLRFKNPFESGYNLQLIPEEPMARRNLGLFSHEHIPANIYYMFMKGPEAVFKNQSHELKFPYITFDSYGLSLFFLSPILLLLYKTDFRQKLVKASLLATIILLVPALTYYGIGQFQVGPRYALDFLPFLFIGLVFAAPKVNLKVLQTLVWWGVFFAIYFTVLYLTDQAV